MAIVKFTHKTDPERAHEVNEDSIAAQILRKDRDYTEEPVEEAKAKGGKGVK